MDLEENSTAPSRADYAPLVVVVFGNICYGSADVIMENTC